MIEQMRFVNIMGNIGDIGRVIDKYITCYEIQLENALKEIKNAGPLESCVESNPYAEYIQMGERFAKSAGLDLNDKYEKIDINNATGLIKRVSDFFEERNESLKALELSRNQLIEFIGTWEPFVSLDFDISILKKFEFIKYRFGRMPLANYKQFEDYVYNQNDILFVESKRDFRFVYGIYFVPLYSKEKVDTVVSSLNFERVYIPFEMGDDMFSDTPQNVFTALNAKLEELDGNIKDRQQDVLSSLGVSGPDIINSYNTVKELSYSFDLRKFAARTHNDYYIFIGWMSAHEAGLLEKDIENDGKAILVLEDSPVSYHSDPPTKLTNNILVKPFEFFVRTYGLPKYGEIDPTPFVAVTYFVLFGAMFGDLGQGLALSILGFLIYKLKKMDLGRVMGFIGISSMFFGLMYGSVFGIEDLIPAMWMKPSENITSILIISVGAGVFLILLAMIFNMANAIKQKDVEKLLLGPNGISGIVFYTAMFGLAAMVILGGSRIALWLIVIFIILPLTIIAFREPISEYLKNKTVSVHGSLPMFLLETVIELFEVLLSYFTNTVSFVRVGAFALSHAGMMSVVLLLAKGASDTHNPVVMILGNILVMAMEGLVVGIQVLRIEFYELFSRYYEGGGREFVPTSYNERRISN